MTDWQKDLLLIGSGILAGVVLYLVGAVSYRAGQRNPVGGPSLPVNVKTDTLVVRDTIREKYPVYVDRWKERTELVQVRDTIRRTDTLYMAVEIEAREFRGDDYRAVVTGWQPDLKEISVFPKTIYLQTEVTQPAPAPTRKPRVGFGFTAGPAVIWTPDGIKTGAGVAGGLSITF